MGFFNKTIEDVPESIEQLVELNRQLDDEMDRQINQALESEILLPEQVVQKQKQKEDLETIIEDLRKTVVELKKERDELGGKTLEQLLKEKNDLTTEIQLMEENLRRNPGMYVMNTVCSGSQPVRFYPSGARI